MLVGDRGLPVEGSELEPERVQLRLHASPFFFEARQA